MTIHVADVASDEPAGAALSLPEDDASAGRDPAHGLFAIGRPPLLFACITALFVTSLVVADIIGSRLITFRLPLPLLPGLEQTVLLSSGILPFPITFVLTDTLNEFYGPRGARLVTWIGLGMAIFTYILLTVARTVPTHPQSPISAAVFEQVFGLSSLMFLASLTAYLVGQWLDISIFQLLRKITGRRMLWLRATGSTVLSQLVDTLVVTGIAFTGKLPMATMLHLAGNNYFWKFMVAVAMTPLCYLLHGLVTRYVFRRQ
jgi:uncharacterized integral membrane protein (TIGR00697 family)